MVSGAFAILIHQRDVGVAIVESTAAALNVLGWDQEALAGRWGASVTSIPSS